MKASFMKASFMKALFHEGFISLFYEGFIGTVSIPEFWKSGIDSMKDPLNVE